MRLCPPDHPLAKYMPKWRSVHQSMKNWNRHCRETLLLVESFFNGRGVPAWANIHLLGLNRYSYLNCVFRVDDSCLGWINLYNRALRPTLSLKDAPIICTVSVNCLAPPVGSATLKWMEAVDCRPPLTWPQHHLDKHGYPSSSVIRQQDADIFQMPDQQLIINCHICELKSVTLQAAAIQVGWLRGNPWNSQYDEYGLVVPEERWTPLALEVYEAWQALLAQMDEGQLVKLFRSTSKRRFLPKGVKTPVEKMSPSVREAFLQTFRAACRRPPQIDRTTS